MERCDKDRSEDELFRDISIEDLLNRIIYCKSEGKCTRAYMTNGESALFAISLAKVEECLPQTAFFRVHNTYLINSRYVKRVNYADTRKSIIVNSA